MKFEQAMRAMRRGEKVRRKNWPKGQFLSYRDNTFVTKHGTHNVIEFGKDGFNDPAWVILRKKKKPEPEPIYPFAEADFEPVGTMPNVGDVVCRVSSEPRGFEGKERETLIRNNDSGYPLRTVCGRIFKADDPVFTAAGNALGTRFRILKRPLRDVFKDPRVGDVIGLKKTEEPGYVMTWAVVHVTPKSVRFVCGDVGEQSRDGWAENNSYTVIHRAEG